RSGGLGVSRARRGWQAGGGTKRPTRRGISAADRRCTIRTHVGRTCCPYVGGRLYATERRFYSAAFSSRISGAYAKNSLCFAAGVDAFGLREPGAPSVHGAAYRGRGSGGAAGAGSR